jgi:acyl carrier protein
MDLSTTITAAAPTRQEAEQVILSLIADITADWDLEELEIGPQTKLLADLGFSSIDILDFMSAVDRHYGRRFRWTLLIVVDGLYVDDLSVGQIAGFVADHFDVEDDGERYR